MPDLKYSKFRPTGVPEKFSSGTETREYSEPAVELLYDYFIREADRWDENFRRLFAIYGRAYDKRKALASQLAKLLWYDECPDKFIFRMAENLGFPLLDAPYAGEKERRNFLKYAVWLFKRKGTLAALTKIFTILGYTPVIEEDVKEDFYINFHKFYGLDQRTYELFSDDFNDGNAEGWAKQNPASDWQALNNKYIGTGSGFDSRDNCAIVANIYKRFYFQTDFQILGGSGAHFPYFGIYLSYNGAWTSSFSIFFHTDGGTDFLTISPILNGGLILNQSYDITGKVDYKTGRHTLKAQYYKNKISVGIDDTTLISPYVMPGEMELYWPLYYKGLFANESTQVAFDNVQIRRLKSMGAPAFPGGDSQRLLHIWLYGSPQNAAAKKEYLQDVIPKHFVPTGVQVDWEN